MDNLGSRRVSRGSGVTMEYGVKIQPKVTSQKMITFLRKVGSISLTHRLKNLPYIQIWEEK